MDDLGQRLDNIHVRVRAPGADIEATLRRRGDIDLEFSDSVYEFISERALEDALANLARLLWVGWQRQYRTEIDETGLDIDANDQHDLNFFTERKELEIEGRSEDQRIAITATGMENIVVRITPGTIRAVPEREFVASAKQAATRLIRDFQDKTGELKKRYYTQ